MNVEAVIGGRLLESLIGIGAKVEKPEGGVSSLP